jgi:hypothetical protein
MPTTPTMATTTSDSISNRADKTGGPIVGKGRESDGQGVTGQFVLDDRGQVAEAVVVRNGREMRAKK